MKKIGVIFLVLSIYACSQNKEPKLMTVSGEAQGTTYHISYLDKNEVNYQRSIDSMLIEIDKSMSTYHKTSIITKINQTDSAVKVDQMFKDVFLMSKQVYAASEGAFDPTVAPLVNAWGFGFKNLEKTDSSSIDSLLQFVDFDSFTLKEDLIIKSKPNLMLDFNAIAQGYSVDVIANFLSERGIENYMVEIGGEVLAKGKNNKNNWWRIGIDKPIENEKERTIEAVISLQNKALATSGNYRKFYEKNGVKYSHTLNPKTGYPVRHSLLSATVITDNCAMADAYATVFMVVGLEKAKEILEKNSNLKALLIFEDENKTLKTFVSKDIESTIEMNNKN
ncbi:MAG: FAD:protein FMN transferase [Flavobacteriales bacterium]|nr:FAD:protein FMN transferase [Flavobacteriales bacterium]